MTSAASARELRTPGSLVRVVTAALLLAGALAVVGPISRPAPVAAATATEVEAKLLSLINAERLRRGLVAERPYSKLTDLAGDRAAYMASINRMEHISCLGCTLNSRDVNWISAGEVIAWSSYPSDQVAQMIFNGWMNSSSHRAILMSSTYNYIGVGAALRTANNYWYSSIVVVEKRDHTKPYVRTGTASRSGSTLTWTWTGADTKLQTHTAGLKNFDVQYRVGDGTWSTIKSGTTAKSLSLTRGTGTYGIRVRARDNRDYISSWSSEMRIVVP